MGVVYDACAEAWRIYSVHRRRGYHEEYSSRNLLTDSILWRLGELIEEAVDKMLDAPEPELQSAARALIDRMDAAEAADYEAEPDADLDGCSAHDDWGGGIVPELVGKQDKLNHVGGEDGGDVTEAHELDHRLWGWFAATNGRAGTPASDDDVFTETTDGLWADRDAKLCARERRGRRAQKPPRFWITVVSTGTFDQHGTEIFDAVVRTDRDPNYHFPYRFLRPRAEVEEFARWHAKELKMGLRL